MSEGLPFASPPPYFMKSLQAVVRHSETGLMSAHWTPTDHVRMRRQLLAWDPADSELIRAGLVSR